MTNHRSEQPKQQGLVITNPMLTNLTNPIAMGVGNDPPPPLGGGVVTNPDGGNVGNTSPALPTLDELVDLKHRINNGVSYCLKHRGPRTASGYGRPEHELWDDLPTKFVKGHARLVRILSRDYLPALDALRETYPSEALLHERDELTDRLERGWQMEDSPAVGKTFARLLVRYEVISDALDGDVLARHLARVERVAA